jgi:hypothetical protein
MSSFKKKIAALILLPLVAFFIIYNQPAQDAKALSGSEFKAGRIIDDVVFQNKSSMSVAQIQEFLNARVPVCDTNGDKLMWSGGPKRRDWAAANNKPLPPYTCLNQYMENPTTKENNAGRPSYSVPGGLSAAQLIYNASQAQNINPQVFIVLLQKEQGLITDDWPFPIQFERATGNNCPDTAPCDPKYVGFYTQVFNAGAQFNYYVNNFDRFNYAPGWNTIQLHPNAACGTQNIFIENRFTAALYIYTPYAPNAAALNNLYGTGDSCSAYGNRNFWRMFNDWFGSPLSNGPAPMIGTFNLRTEPKLTATKIAVIDVSTVSKLICQSTGDIYTIDGESSNIWVHVEVNGGTGWIATNASVRSRLNNDGLISCSEYFKPKPAVKWVYQTAHATVPSSSVHNVIVRYKNIGNVALGDNIGGRSDIGYLRIAIAEPGNRVSVFNDGWPSDDRLADRFYKIYDSQGNEINNDNIVEPGEFVEFKLSFRIKKGIEQRSYREFFMPVLDGSENWNLSNLSWADFVVENPVYKYVFIDQSLNRQSSSIFNANFRVKNTGTAYWYDGFPNGFSPVRLASTNPINRASIFSDTWEGGNNRPNVYFSSVYESDGVTLSSNQKVVKPGQIVKFEFKFTIKSNIQSGFYREYFQLILEGDANWNMPGMLWLDLNI